MRVDTLPVRACLSLARSLAYRIAYCWRVPVRTGVRGRDIRVGPRLSPANRSISELGQLSASNETSVSSKSWTSASNVRPARPTVIGYYVSNGRKLLHCYVPTGVALASQRILQSQMHCSVCMRARISACMCVGVCVNIWRIANCVCKLLMDGDVFKVT